MDERHLGYARAALGGNRTLHGFPYQQYHRSAQLPDGTVCLLQFDYSMPYGSPALQGRLPEFQTCATAVLLAAWLAAGALSTRHFAGLLRRDAALLTAATGAIAARRLDLPLDGGARVRELRVSVFGAELMTSAARLSYPGEIAAVLAGPAVNLLCALVLGGAHAWVAAGAHLSLCLFNLLPVRPLDGGRALYLAAAWLAGPSAAERIACWAGGTTALALGGLVLWLIGRTGGSLWLLPAAFGLLAAALRELHGRKADFL